MQYRVLIAEDERLIRENLAEKIAQLPGGYTVLPPAANGLEALKTLREREADLLITDIRMPVMDGLALAREARAIRPRLQVVFLSGYQDFTYARQAILLGVTEYLVKPVKSDQLERMLRRHVAMLEGERVEPMHHPESEPASETVARITDYLHQNIAKSLTLEEMSRAFSFTPSYLIRLFKRETNDTPINYLIRIRMDTAKKILLLYPQEDIGSVAARVGYEDPQYFSRVFKQTTGMTPSQYRRSGY